MNLLTAILIFALNGGIVGSPTENIETYIHIMPEVGVKLNDAYLTAQYYAEVDRFELNEGNYAEAFVNGELRLNLYVDTDYSYFGITYTYDMTTAEDSVCIHFRIQSYK